MHSFEILHKEKGEICLRNAEPVFFLIDQASVSVHMQVDYLCPTTHFLLL